MSIDGGLRSLFRQNIMGDWCSVESGTTGGGIPDSNYCIEGHDGWIEYKQTTGWAVTLRPEQVGWIARRVRNGGTVWIAVRQQAPAGPRRPPRDALWLFRGTWAARAKAEGLRGPWVAEAAPADLHVYDGGPARWGWRAIHGLLTRS